MPHLINFSLLASNAPIKLLTRHLWYHPSLPSTPLNHLGTDERANTSTANYRYSKNEFPPYFLLSTPSSAFLRIFTS